MFKHFVSLLISISIILPIVNYTVTGSYANDKTGKKIDTVANDKAKTKGLTNNSEGIDKIDKYGATKLIYAVNDKDIELAKKLINQGADVNFMPGEFFHTHVGFPLMIAAGNGDVEMVKLLLKNGADVNLKDNWNMNALFGVVLNRSIDNETNQFKVIQILIDAGVDLELIAVDNGNVLEISQYDETIFKLLIKNGADVNVQSLYGYTYLAKAVESNSIEWVKYLLKNGADYKIKNRKDGKTALMIAKEKGYNDIIAVLKKAGAK